MSTIRDRATETARRVFGWAELRPGQLDAIEEVATGSDVLVVMATGYGKSAVYQVAGHLIPGPTVVVSPLISLQIDQVRHIGELTGSAEAVVVNSAQSSGANARSWAAIRSTEAEFLFLAPEQFARPDVLAALQELRVGLFVVDEAHSVSSWGHDFRPDYLRLGEVIDRLGRPPVLALTATGSPPVRTEVVQRLGMRDPKIFVGGFDRPNIHLSVRRHESEGEKIRAVVAEVVAMPKPGLVYVATHAQSEQLAGLLGGTGLRSAAYHGALPSRQRRETQAAFSADAYDVVVATSAFGMGIDKPDVRFVIHADVPESIDSYYQELGRGGRDGAAARAGLHYRQEDLALSRFFTATRPDVAHLDAVVGVLAEAAAPLPLAEVQRSTGLSVHAVENIVNDLRETGCADETPDGVVLSGIRRDTAEIRAAVVALGEQRVRVEQSRLAMMRTYAETLGCRRRVLLAYFGDFLAEPCGNCDTCDSGTAYRQPAHPPGSTPFRRGQRVDHAVWGRGEVIDVGADRLTAFFPTEGYRVVSLAGTAVLRPAEADPGGR
jgi:ATP-dependent DNA helicase RecQ